MSQRRPANQTPVIVLALVCRSLVFLIFKIDKNVDKKRNILCRVSEMAPERQNGRSSDLICFSIKWKHFPRYRPFMPGVHR